MASFAVHSPTDGRAYAVAANSPEEAAAAVDQMSAAPPQQMAGGFDHLFSDLPDAAQPAPSAGPQQAPPQQPPPGPAAPAAASPDQLFADLPDANRVAQAFGPDNAPNARPDQQAALDAKLANRGSILDPLAQGLTMGFGDEILGTIMGGLTFAAGQGFDAGYNKITRSARADLESYRNRHPYVAMGAEIAGSLPAAAVPVGAAGAGASLLGRVGAGAAAGALYGGVTGFGSGEGSFSERLVPAGEGAVAGGIVGGAIPLAVAGAKAVAKPVADAVRARVNPAGYATRKVADRIAASGGRTIDQAAGRIDRAAGAGQTLRLADAGGASTRDLLRTASNIPGPGRDSILTKVNLDNARQGSRIKGLIADVFADPDNAYQAAKATVMDARSRAATPYFEAAWRTPVPFTRDLEGLLNTPAGRQALAAARANTANRREPWAQWFLNIADDGSIIDARRVPDSRALHEIKMALDQMVEATKAAPDGSPFARARDTAQSRAIQTVRDDLNNFLKAHNPAYRRALAESMDNIQADQALEFGRNALSTDPRVIARRMGDPTAYGRDSVFNDGQRELARVGLAEALRAKIDKMGDLHNVMRIFGNPQVRSQVNPFFRNNQERSAFTRAILAEARKARTNVAPTANSTTARQLMDMQDAGTLGEGVKVATDAARNGIVQASLNAVVSGLRRLGGFTPRVADEVGRILMETDPAKVQQIISAIRDIEARQLSAAQRASLIRSTLTKMLGGIAGREFGRESSVPQVAQ